MDSPSVTKPTASVMPQIHTNCVAVTTTEPATEVPAAMATETDEAETTVSVEMSPEDSDIERCNSPLVVMTTESMTSQRHSSPVVVMTTQLMTSERRNSPVVMTTQSSSPVVVTTESMTSAPVHCRDTNCCNKADITVWGNDLLVPDDRCHSNTRCSDYEAASVLSDMEKLATIAAAAAPATTSPAAANSSPAASGTLSAVSSMSDVHCNTANTGDCSTAASLPVTSQLTLSSGHICHHHFSHVSK